MSEQIPDYLEQAIRDIDDTFKSHFLLSSEAKRELTKAVRAWGVQLTALEKNGHNIWGDESGG